MNRKEFLQTSALLLPASIWGASKVQAASVEPTAIPYLESTAYKAHARTLKFNADGKFKIVQFTDVHWVPEKETASEVAAERMSEILDAEKPDLVIYTGDVAFGKPVARCYERAFEPVISRKIPFTLTFGNHDDEQDLSRQEIFDLIKDMPGNLTGTVEGLSGVTNFVLPIRNAADTKDAFLLYHFDSLSYSPMKEVKGYDWIKQDQINWYRECATKFTEQNGGKPLPALAFFHIPLPEYNEAARDESALLIGVRKEPACAPKINSGLFTSMKEMGDVFGVFVGHDHVNDYAVRWKDILLAYGRYTGGKTVYCDVPWGNGGRVIELTEGTRELTSWVRLKAARIENKFSYPQDFSAEPW